MKHLITTFRFGVAGAMMLLLAAPASFAQAYPSRPVRIIVSLAPGGTGDVVGRLLAQGLQTRMNQSFVVENRPGAGGQIGSETVARSAPDGYTLVISSPGGFTILPALRPKVPYDPIKDFTHVSNVARNPLVFAVAPAVPVRDMTELIKYAKAKPGAIRYGSAGVGSVLHLATELVIERTGIEMIHIPFKGGVPVIQALISGEIEMGVGGPVDMPKRAATGALRMIGQTSPTRHPLIPNVPTLAEAGLGDVAVMGWFGLSAPAGLPVAVLGRLHKETIAFLEDAEVKSRLTALGCEPAPMTPPEFTRLIAEETRMWAKTFKAKGITPED